MVVVSITGTMQAFRDDLPPGVLDLHLQETNMHQLHFLFSGPEETPYAGGMCVATTSQL